MPEQTDTQEASHVAPTPMPLMQLATGFWASKTLAAAHELDLFSSLSGNGGTTAAELAEREGIDQRPAEMLLTGCASHGLLEGTRGRYRNSELAEEYLEPGKAVLLRRLRPDARSAPQRRLGPVDRGHPHQQGHDVKSLETVMSALFSVAMVVVAAPPTMAHRELIPGDPPRVASESSEPGSAAAAAARMRAQVEEAGLTPAQARSYYIRPAEWRSKP